MQNQSIYQPSQALIDNWKIWIAREVIQQWQTTKTVPKFDPKEILDVDIKIFSQTFEDLKLFIQEQKSITNADEIKLAVAEIKAWVELRQKNLEQVCQQLIFQGREKLLGLSSKKINPQELLALLAKLTSFWQIQQKDLEEKKNYCIKREYSAWDAYRMLSRKLKLSEPESVGFKNNLGGIWNGLSIHFVAKLQVEIYGLYLRVLRNLHQQIQSLSDTAKSSAMFLAQIEQSLKADCIIEITSVPIFAYLQKVDPNRQRDLLEIWIGHSLNYWGRTPIVSWQKVKEKLLSNIEPIAWDCCRDFVSVFLECSELGQINTNNIYQLRGLGS